ncbi:hypothetical protein ACWCOT_41620 [Nonomuraea bangladeshensis]
MTGTDRDLTDAVRAEVVRHHQVIEQWLAGRAPRAAFDLFSAAHAPGFTMVAPDGRLLSRGDVLAEVEPAYGGRPDADRDQGRRRGDHGSRPGRGPLRGVAGRRGAAGHRRSSGRLAMAASARNLVRKQRARS